MRPKKDEIFVTKTVLPSLIKYNKYLKKIWKNNWVTNYGPLTLELERKLKKYLDAGYCLFVSNGTVALEIALKSLDIEGEIITTPFSYVATTSSIVWTNCTPVFVDIKPDTLCIDSELIEEAITNKTKAILATHVYGIPCEVEKIQIIAQKHNLKVIYDAAHCFGVKYKNKAIVNYGDASTLSFHATKLFHTAEGGAIVTNHKDIAHIISYLRNFGHRGEEAFWGLGINGKNSELHAAMGLCLFPRVNVMIKQRKRISYFYDRLLKNSDLTKLKIDKNVQHNFSYYPLIFSSETQLLRVRNILNKNGIFPRRYFYPSLNTLNYIKKKDVEIAEDISRRILCLPLYPGLSAKNIKKISEIIISNL